MGSAHPKMGIFAWFGIRIPFADRMRMIRDAGFQATSLWWEQDDPSWRRLCQDMPDMARSAGLFLDNAHVPFRRCGALWSPRESERRAAVDEHIAWVEDCARHRIPRMVMHVTSSHRPPAPDGFGLESLRRILDAAEDLEVELVIENTRSSAHIDHLLEAFDSPALRLCYDSGHDALHAERPMDLLRAWGHRLGGLHLSDTDGRLDRHWIPGEGIVDFEALARAFPWRTYSGTHLLEVVPRDPEEPPAAFLNRAHDHLAAWLRRDDSACR